MVETRHWIQREILHRLCKGSPLRYAELKPREVEGNLFMYHLGRLQAEHLVTKQAGRYGLSSEGKRYADKLSFKTLRPREQPKILSVVAVKNRRGEWLVHRRQRHFPGLESFVSGKLHFGESLAEAAARELKEKANLQASLRYRGEVFVTVHQDGEVISQMLCHLFTGGQPTGTLQWDETVGPCFWKPISDPADPAFAPWFKDLFRMANSRKAGLQLAEVSYDMTVRP